MPFPPKRLSVPRRADTRFARCPARRWDHWLNPVGRSLRVLWQPVTGAAVLFYAIDDDRAGEEVERLIRTAGFEPVKAGGI
jgi:hypothetical protein